MLLDDEHFALVAARAPRRAANRVGRLDRRERLVAVDDVKRFERLREMRVELVRAQLHLGYAGFFAACSLRMSCWTASVCISFSRRSSCVPRASTWLSLNV